jgi:hypothetical protein
LAVLFHLLYCLLFLSDPSKAEVTALRTFSHGSGPTEFDARKITIGPIIIIAEDLSEFESALLREIGAISHHPVIEACIVPGQFIGIFDLLFPAHS